MKRNYSGKRVFIGIDVHKKTYAVTAISDGIVVKRDTLGAKPENVTGYCRKFFPKAQIISAYEAGFSGFGLHRQLVAEDILNHVVHPAARAF